MIVDESNGRESVDAESLTDEDRARIAALSLEQLAAIDATLLSQCDRHFRKVAYIGGYAMSREHGRAVGVPDVIYAQRVRRLVDQGLLEAVGNLAYMRYSEVRVAPPITVEGRPNQVSEPTQSKRKW